VTMSEDTSEQPAEGDPQQLSFEQAIDQLEQLIEKIESGEVGLEAALKHYEQGTALIKRCRSILDKAEQRIADLTENEAGELQIEEPTDEQENEAQ